MMDEQESALLERVKETREELVAHVSRLLPRKQRLTNLTIIGGSIATVLTAAPALGGESFASWLAEAFDLGSPVWKLRCAGAALCSASATVATQMLKSHDLETKLAAAQTAAARLEVIAVGLQSGNIEVSTATAEYNGAWKTPRLCRREEPLRRREHGIGIICVRAAATNSHRGPLPFNHRG